MNNDEKFQFEDDQFCGIPPKQVVQDLLELTRTLGIKISAESDKIPHSLPENKVVCPQ